MYDTIYIEREVERHARAKAIAARFPEANIVRCDSYAEIFNRKKQDFRLQKANAALMLARKHGRHVLRAPDGYGFGGAHNYYFSTMLNCMYDCRYCFLQGMYRSAHHVVFVNYEDFADAIDEAVSKHAPDEEVWFYSGYDCDSLALEPVVEAAGYFVERLSARSNAVLELRTKSTQVRGLLGREAAPNVVVAFSLTPDEISRNLEHKVPNVRKRIEAMANLQEQGWKIGLRFDPLVYAKNFKEQYRSLFESLFDAVDALLVHSVSVGVFRLPKGFFRNMETLYPDDRFLSLPFELKNGMVSYPLTMENEMVQWCTTALERYVDKDRIYRATVG